MPKVKLETIVAKEMEDQVVDAIIESAQTGKIGDGKIFITDLKDIIRIRTGDKGKEAI